MDNSFQSPEHLPVAPQQQAHPEGAVENQQDVIDTIGKRVSQLERLKESSTQAGGVHDDEDQQAALQAAKSAKKGGRFVNVMGKDVDLNVVTSRFFSHQAKRISDIVKKDMNRAAEWLASLRDAWKMWEDGPKNGKSLHVVVLAVVMFWKV